MQSIVDKRFERVRVIKESMLHPEKLPSKYLDPTIKGLYLMGNPESVIASVTGATPSYVEMIVKEYLKSKK